MIKAKGLVADCITGAVAKVEIDFDNTSMLAQELLEGLKPSDEKIRKAEIELVSIELLMEVGLI